MNAAKQRSPREARTVEAALSALGSDRATGLAEADASARLAKEGPNEVAEKRSHPILRFAKKFWGLSAWMIELIAALSLFLHKRADFGIALGLLVANAILSSIQEQRALAAVEALRSKLQVTARVLRGGSWRAAQARELVTGDVVRVRAGDFVPADVQLFDGALRVDQSALTGESRRTSTRPQTTPSMRGRRCARVSPRASSWRREREPITAARPSSWRARTRSCTSKKSPRVS